MSTVYPSGLKPLYQCANVDELQNEACRTTFKSIPKRYRTVLQSALKIYDEAVLKDQEGDEEVAYIYYMRAVALFQQCKKCADFKPAADLKYWSAMTGKRFGTAVKRAEELFTSLKRRYELQEEIEKVQEREVMEDGVPSMGDGTAYKGNAARAKVLPNDVLGVQDIAIVDYPFPAISCGELYIAAQDKDTSFLIIDMRQPEDFQQSTLAFSNSVINIPASVVKSCLTASSIEKNLQPSERITFRKRHNVDYVVLVDYDLGVADVQPGHYTQVMYDALVQFDSGTLKHKPFFLVGGFKSWLLQYPTLTTNPLCGLTNGTNAHEQVTNDELTQDVRKVSYPKLDNIDAAASILTKQEKKSNSESKPKTVIFAADVTKEGSGIRPSVKSAPSFNRTLKPAVKGAGSRQAAETPGVTSFQKVQEHLDAALTRQIDMKEALNRMESTIKAINRSGGQTEAATSKPKQCGSSTYDMRPDEIQRIIEENKRLIMLIDKTKQVVTKGGDEIADEQKPVIIAEPRTLPTSSSVDQEAIAAEMKKLKQENHDLLEQLRISKQQALAHLELAKQAELERLRRLKHAKHEQPPSVSADVVDESPETPAEETPTLLKQAEIATMAVSPAPAAVASGEGRPSRLRRCQSSPNIAKDQEAGASVQVSAAPTVPDRRLKPVDASSERLRYELDFFTKRMRSLTGTFAVVKGGLTGLKNMGNTCYMNCVVQCLSNTVPFAEHFRSGDYRTDINYDNDLGSGGRLAREFAVLISAMWERSYKYVVPSEFKQCVNAVAPLFAGFDQHDAQEFLIFLLDGLHEDLNRVKARYTLPEQNNEGISLDDAAHRAWQNHLKLNQSIVVQLFQGQYMSIVKCRICHKSSTHFDVFMHLSLPIPDEEHCTLEKCLQSFLAPELIAGDSGWLCPHCQRRRDAVKQIVITKLPPILLIHLKRFSHSGRWREKLQTPVDFPVSSALNLCNYVQGNSSQNCYRLYGVSNHYGTMEGGHYIAYCKNHLTNRWYKFEDQEVNELSHESVKSSAAYILFYTSRNW